MSAFVVSSLWCSAEQAATRPAIEPSYRVTHWTTDQGLPQNRISCLKQARNGYLWVGTWAGLARFDGVRFTVFDKFNTPELVNDSINALAEDAAGTLWIGTADGLVSYREHRFRRLTMAEGLPDRKVWHLAASRNGGLWLHAGGYAALLDSGRILRSWLLQPTVRQSVLSMSEEVDGSLSILRGDAWLTLSPRADGLRTNLIAAPPFDFWLSGLPASPPGTFVAGTVGGVGTGLHRWEKGNWTAVGNGRLSPASVDFIFEDRSTNLWVNARPGQLHRWDGQQWTQMDLGEHFAPAATVCMEEDREGILWLGTERGLVQLQARRVRTYTTRDGLAGEDVWSVCEEEGGAIWVGGQSGLSRIEDGRVVPLKEVEPAAWAQDTDRCLWPRQGGGVWIAKSLGIMEYRDEFTLSMAASALPSQVFALLEDRAGRLWIGTEMGAGRIEGGRVIAAYAYPADRVPRKVMCILEDRAGAFWFGTQGQGLHRLWDGKLDVFTMRDGLSSDQIWAIQEDAEGTLWVGSENGLTRYRDGHFFAFTRQQGLLENGVNCVLEDNFGYLWLSGLRGIYRVERKQLDAVADGGAVSFECAAFGTADGMESSETNGEHQPAGWKARDGRLWFATVRGVVVIDPRTIHLNQVPPPVVVEQVKADGEVIFGDHLDSGSVLQDSNPRPSLGDHPVSSSSSGRRLAAGRGRILEIRYTANSFADPLKVRFRSRLIGQDSRWREAGGSRLASYTELRPGQYRFEVDGCNNHGVWSAVPAGFAFSVAPYPWRTWPFYALCTLLVVATGFGLHYSRVRGINQLRRLEQQHALDLERARIARDIHDDLGSRFLQMSVLGELADRSLARPAEAQPHLDKLRATTGEAFQALDEIVWAANPKQDSLEGLLSYLREYAPPFLALAGVQCRLEFPNPIPNRLLTAEVRHHLFLVVKEALQNVAKHAQASECRVRIEVDEEQLKLEMKDNGCGFDTLQLSTCGNGLANMGERMAGIGGAFSLVSAPGQGVEISLRLPLRATV